MERTTLLPAEESFIRIMPGSLPSRAADNLFWLGRYIERAEGALRILRAWHGRFAETADTEMPLLTDVTDYLAGLDIDTEEAGARKPDAPTSTAPSIPPATSATASPPDGWLALNDLAKTARRFPANRCRPATTPPTP